MKMTEEQQRKQRFVERKLGPMVQAATEGWVSSLSYVTWGAEEEVLMTTGNGLRSVCVTADSEWAIAKDVMAALAAWYE